MCQYIVSRMTRESVTGLYRPLALLPSRGLDSDTMMMPTTAMVILVTHRKKVQFNKEASNVGESHDDARPTCVKVILEPGLRQCHGKQGQ